MVASNNRGYLFICPDYSIIYAKINNGSVILAIASSNLLYDLLGGHWIILCLIWPFGFALHGFTLRLFWTIRKRSLSPGLATSVIYWIMAYFLARYSFLARQIPTFDFWAGVLLGVLRVGGFRSFVPTVVIPVLIRRR